MSERIKRKGGKMQYTQTIFNHTSEAFKSFEEDVLKCIRRDRRESLKSCARISFKIEWEPEGVAYLLNEQVIAKDKLGNYIHDSLSD